MSLSLLDRWFGETAVVLGAERVSLRQAGRERVRPVAAADGGWGPSVAALAELLAGTDDRRRPRRTRVVVSNAFVRFVLVPWSSQRLTPQERQELLRQLFAERHGERAGQWRVVAEGARFERQSLAAAVDAELLAALHGTVAAAGLRLRSLVPALAANHQRWRARIGAIRRGWFADVADGRLTTVAFDQNGWQALAHERFQAGGAIALADALLPVVRRDALRFPGLMGGTVCLHNPSRLPCAFDGDFPLVTVGGDALDEVGA